MLLLLLAVAGFNAWVDATGTLGTGLVDPMAQLPKDRRAKVAVVQAAGDPDLVVLGTSRAKRLDPRTIDPTAKHPVNAAVVGADLFESRVLTAWLAQRAEQDHAPFPHLVVGVDVEAFRAHSLRSSSLLAVPQLRTLARRAATDSEDWRDTAGELPDLLLTWSATRESWASLNARAEAVAKAQDLSATDEGSKRTRDAGEFDAAGIANSDRAWFDRSRLRKLARRVHADLAPTIAEYEARYERDGATLDPGSVRDLRTLIRTANQHDEIPTLVITPAHPALARDLASRGRPARHAAVLMLLRSEERRGHVRLVDCSACVPGLDRYWMDGVHPSPLGARFMAAAVRRAERSSDA